MKKTVILLFILCAVSILQTNAQSVTITESSGWLESVFVEWEPVASAESYNVYYSGNGVVNRKIDDQLIRSYGTYFRADILGLKAGGYTVKVAPVISGVEGSASQTSTLTVMSHDRTGFAFHGGRVPGAYKADGTPKDGAVILYITENNKNTVSMNVTGANANPCVGLQTILDGFKKGNDTRPLIVRLIGQITDLEYMLAGDIVIENKENASSYITFEGVGNDAVADGWGLRIKNATNIEVRNLGFMNCDSDEGDNIGLQQDNSYIWVHNCDLFYGHAGSDGDQAKGDGALDAKRSKYLTISYNHFWDTGKSNLLGLGEGTTADYYATYHHNWYDHSDSRHPRVRFFSTHVYNNYYDGVSKYGVGATMGSSIFVEGNVFRNCKYPMLISMQGSDIVGGTGTFSSEDGGIIKAYNNVMSGQARFVAYDAVQYPVEFDAYVASSRGEIVSSAVKSKKGGNTYNNFDTDAAFYVKNLVIDSPNDAKDKVMQYSGRVQGGDFKWTFNNAVDDASYAVNTALKSALTSYTTDLVAIQGESSSVGNTQILSSTANRNQTVSEGQAIEAIVFTWSGDATDANVSGLPASGITVAKNSTAKTITISGTPTATVSYTVTTSGASGTPVSLSGTITLAEGGGTSEGEMIHNFTTDGKNSTFYSITGNLSTGKGTVTYNGLTLTQCLKMESSTSVSFTTTEKATLTLVFIESGKRVKVNGVSHTSDGNGIVTVSLNPGTHTVTKDETMNLFYMSTVYDDIATNNAHKADFARVDLYPNPVGNKLYIASDSKIQKVEIYSMSGQILKTVKDNVSAVDFSPFANGNYIIRVTTSSGVVSKIISKK